MARRILDHLAPSAQKRGLRIRASFQAVIEEREIPPYADVRELLAAEAAVRKSDGWHVESEPKPTFPGYHVSRAGTRLLVMIEKAERPIEMHSSEPHMRTVPRR